MHHYFFSTTEARFALEQESTRRQRRLLFGVSLALLVAIASGIATLYSYRRLGVVKK